jgi:FAD/FMN-containing dehydrogenase
MVRSTHELSYITDRSEPLPSFSQNIKALAYGNGRSYGDVCLNPDGGLWLTSSLNKFISFNQDTGLISCEAGLLLKDIQSLVIPRGWILPVTPGTQLSSVGGAVANDIHGKNHHVKGAFGNHVKRIKLLRTDGSSIECTRNLQPELFSATIGGLGLTGVIVEVEIQLARVSGPWLDTETIPYTGIAEFLSLADSSESGWEYTVSWIDCLSGKKARGIFMRANHSHKNYDASPTQRELKMPFTPPFSLVNKMTLKSFNFLYRKLQAFKAGPGHAHYESFFYPLDNLADWNKMYGPRGFYQYQSVVPRDAGAEAVEDMLDTISKSGVGSFLAVLKTFGSPRPLGMLSFPEPGLTLALDFPNQGSKTLKLFDRLDEIVREAGGRLYAAKDARMSRSMFEAGYPRLNEFLAFRDAGISSAFSRRVMGY